MGYIYEFRYGGYTWDQVSEKDLPTTEDVQKHMEKVCKKNNLPYVVVTPRKLA